MQANEIPENDILDPNFDSLNTLRDTTKNICLNVRGQKLSQDEPLRPSKFFAGLFQISIRLTEVFSHNSFHSESDLLEEAKYIEVSGWKTRQTFQTIKNQKYSKRLSF